MALDPKSPRVVIAARNKVIAKLREIGGSRMTDVGAADITDWMISAGYLSESVYEDVAAELEAAD